MHKHVRVVILCIALVVMAGCNGETPQPVSPPTTDTLETPTDATSTTPSSAPTPTHATPPSTTGEEGAPPTPFVKDTRSISSSCGTAACFEQAFKDCSPATLTSTMVQGITTVYTIKGKQGGRCAVITAFTQHIDPSWAGKSMTCAYNNSMPFGQAMEEMFTDASICSGHLTALMNQR